MSDKLTQFIYLFYLQPYITSSIVISTNLFGEVVVHVTAVCDCQCTEKPVTFIIYMICNYVLCMLLLNPAY